MNVEFRDGNREPDALDGVARVARALVSSGGLSELSNDAMVEIREALEVDVAALYLAQAGVSDVLRCVGKWATAAADVDVAPVLALEPAASRFVASTGGPLVFRDRTGWVLENPFEPPVDHWVVLPLVSKGRILGAVIGCSPQPVSLSPAAVTRFTLIGDLLSAGAANEMLRAEVQRTELQRERMRLAEGIHESLAQDLAVAVRELALLATRPPAEVARASEDRLRAAVTDAHRVVRRHLDILVSDAQPPGVRAGVEEICELFRARGLTVTLDADIGDDVMDAERSGALLRVLSEALTNVDRHAGVSEVAVAVSSNDQTVHLSVSDRGVGFDGAIAGEHTNGHFGLAIMHRRARDAGGTLRVRSRPGEGTTVELAMPREAPAA